VAGADEDSGGEFVDSIVPGKDYDVSWSEE